MKWTLLSLAIAIASRGARAELPACDSSVSKSQLLYDNSSACDNASGYNTALLGIPGADVLPKLCNNAACLAFFAQLSSLTPSDCLSSSNVKVRTDLIDALPAMCASYTNASGSNTTTAAPTPQATEKKDDGKESTTVRVFKIIGYIIGALVGVFVLFCVLGCIQFLFDCLRGCYFEIKSWFACCCNSQEKHQLVDQHVDHMEMAYVDMERPQEQTVKTTSTAATATTATAPTQSTGASSTRTSSVSTASSRVSEAAVKTLLEDDAIQSAAIPLNELHVGDVINHGAYGQVLRGVFETESVAIKRLLPARRQDMKEVATFLEEAKLMTTLRHENIVRLIGVAWNTQADSLQDSVKDLSIVCELMEGGDLRSMLSHAAENNAPTGFHNDNINIAIDIANALTYMHNIKPSAIVHRDLKSKNVLLTRDLRAKLTDFGISRERADATMTAGVGSFLWMAPEIVFGRRYDEKADVFSFGVLLSELDTHKLPYSQAVEHGSNRKLTEMMIVKMVSEGSLSVDFSSEADSEVVELARACVATSALLRPSAETVLRRLREIGERLAQTKPTSMLEDTNAFSLTTTRRMY